MMRPSDSWPEISWSDFIKTRPEFSNIELNRIPIAASALRSGVACTLSRRFAHGSAHAVFEIVFDDGCVWMCRVRHRDPDESPQYLRMMMDSTVAAIRYVQQYTNVPAPTVYHYQSDPSINGVGSSHMFMEAIPGRKRDLPKEKIDPIGLQTMYNQIADSAVQMARLNFPKIGRIYQLSDGQYEVGPFINPDGSTYGPFSTSGEYYAYVAEKNTKTFATAHQTRSEKVRNEFATHLYHTAASKLLLGNHGPFGLCHGDYGVHNLLFDEKLAMTGVLDWESAQSAPALGCCDWPAMVQVRWPRYKHYWPGVLEKILDRQRMYHEGVVIAERKWQIDTAKFDGQLMSDVVGSDAAIVAQIIQILACDPSYKDYDGKKVFEFLFGDGKFDEAQECFGQAREKSSVASS